MLVRSRRAAALAVGAALLALATACTNPTAPATTPNNVRGMSGGTTIGSSGAPASAPSVDDGTTIGSSG
jgi:hypothetical protein